MKDLSVLSLKLFFFIKAPLKKVRKYIYWSIYFTFIIINSKIVTKKLLNLTDLTKVQTLCIYKLFEVIMVGKIKDLVFAAF